MTITTKIHDKFFRQSMSDLRVAKDFFSIHLPVNIKEQVDLETLQLEKTNFITPRNFVTDEQEEKIVDMLYSARISGDIGYFYVLAEHQSTPDKEMPLRVMRYMLEVIAYHLDKQKEIKKNDADTHFPIVWPLLFYNGKTPYDLTTSFLGMYKRQHMILAEKILTSPFQLVDLNEIEDKELRGHVWGRIMEVAMMANLKKYSDRLEILAKLLTGLVKHVEGEIGGYDYIEDAICYTSRVADMRNNEPTEYLKTVSKELTENNRGKIMALADRLEEKGIEKGVKKTALRLLDQNVDIEIISKATELSVDQIEELKAENQDYFDEKK